MKCVRLALVIAAFILSCNNAGKDKNAGGPDSATADTPAKSGTRTIADAVADLKSVLESKDPNRIAGLVDFPVKDSAMDVQLDDSVFQQNYKAAGNQLTRSLFLKYYDTISKFTYLDKVTEMFKYISLDSLKLNDDVSKEFRNKNEPCYSYYEIMIRDDLVTLSYGTAVNDDYVNKSKAAEGDAAGCTFVVFWVFRFDGNKLVFSGQGTAA